MTHEPVTGSVILQKPHFDLARRGYEKTQVDAHLARVNQEVARMTANLRQERDFARGGSQQLIAERDDALRQLRAAQQELAALRGDGPGVQRPVRDEVSLFGDRLQTILSAAEQEASAAKAEALAAAEQSRVSAGQQAETLVAEAKQEATALVALAREEAATLRAAAKQETDELRAAAKQETDMLLAQARSLAEEVTRKATAEAERVLTSAQRESSGLLDAARRAESETQAQLTDLVQRREQIRSELAGIRATIEDLLGTVAPTAEPAKTA